MATPKGKPRGYFEYILALDCETTGLSYGDDPTLGHQAVSWGIIVADAATLKPIEEVYVEIKWNETSIQSRIDNPNFGKKAEEIHGLTFDYLEEHGVTEEEAAVIIASLIIKYWGPTVSVRTLGHNGTTFDLPFLRQLFRKFDLDVMFGNRHIDSFSVAFITVGAFNSDDLFNTMGLEQRDTHNSLDDARMALESVRRIRLLWESQIGVLAYNRNEDE